ncbi:MAG: sigma-54-dependent Fis family transcriptional regulator [Nitrospirae bacterium]|nr:sigma-54-dependent Fis family transcriptional regulator [Nitrospirota bacterium]
MNRLLIIDDDAVFCGMLTRHFRDEYGAVGFSDPNEAVKYFRENKVDAVLTDLSMPELDGMQVLEIVKAGSALTDVIIMTAYAKVETAVEAMKKGAYDYILKPFGLDEISLQLRRLFEKRALSEENTELRKFIGLTYRPVNIIGESEAAKDIRRFVDRVRQTDFNLLITGESGTGKELVARAVHFTGKRKDRRLLSVHCASLPEPLLERELFGFEKGAFPDANEVRRGLFEEAEGGSVILQGIDGMGLMLQARLLTALENGTVRRSGGDRDIPFDAVVIAVSDADLGRMSQDGAFRRDLFYRLDTFSLRVPPLRERTEDIRLLSEHFSSQYSSEFGRGAMTLTREAVDVLRGYHWPGNVRELKGFLAKICLLEPSETIRPEHILKRLELPNPLERVSSFLNSDRSLTDVEKNLIRESLIKANGNRRVAARLLNISYDTLRYRMKKFEIEGK